MAATAGPARRVTACRLAPCRRKTFLTIPAKIQLTRQDQEDIVAYLSALRISFNHPSVPLFPAFPRFPPSSLSHHGSNLATTLTMRIRKIYVNRPLMTRQGIDSGNSGELSRSCDEVRFK